MEKNILGIVYHPSELGIPIMPETDPLDYMEYCVRVYKYRTGMEALNAFAEKPCTVSKLFDNEKEASKWCEETFKRLFEN